MIKIWAKNKINDLGENRHEVVQVSKDYGVESKFTGYVARKKNIFY